MAYIVQTLPQSLLNGMIYTNRNLAVRYTPIIVPGIPKTKKPVLSAYPKCITIPRTLICYDPVVSGDVFSKTGEVLPDDD